MLGPGRAATVFGVSATPDATPAGWYDDEADASRLRYWDGAKWSPHTAPKPTGAASAPGPEAADAAASTGTGTTPVDDGIDESTTVRPGTPVASGPPAGPAEDTVTIIRTPPPAPGAAPAALAAPLPGPVPTLPPVPPAPAAPGAPFVPAAPAANDGRVEEHTTLPLAPGAASAGFSYEPYRTEGRTFVATWLFAMLLGYWGADRFYLGKTGTAIAKLLTVGGLGVWVLVDLLLVLFGAQRDRDGRPLVGYEEHKRVAWIVTGSLVALAIVSSVVSNIVAFSMR